jgi:alpha-tubulin suppressor-like RCC1 family protein
MTASLETIVDIGYASSTVGIGYALTNSGSLWSWGYNDVYAEGSATTGYKNPTVKLTGVTRILANNITWFTFDYYAASIVAEKEDGYYRCGRSQYEQCGTGVDQDNQVGFTKMNFPNGVRLKSIDGTSNTDDVIIHYGVSTDDRIYAERRNISSDSAIGRTMSPIDVTGMINYR